jgi:hypothetical protein
MSQPDEGLESYEEWQLVGDVYYAKRQLYDMAWGGASIDLDFMR